MTETIGKKNNDDEEKNERNKDSQSASSDTLQRNKDESLAPVNPSGNIYGPEITIEEIMPYFKSFRLKDWAYLVGGIVENGKTRGDIDILVRDKERNKALEFRIYRQFPPSLQHRIHFIYDEDGSGPFTSFIPLYTETAELKNPLTKTEMSDKEEEKEKERTTDTIIPGTFFRQLKGIVGYRKNEVYNIESLKELIASKPDFYPVEVDQKFDGMRVQIHKIDKENVKIWSEDGGDVTNRFPSIVKDTKAINFDSVVLDAEITGWTGKKPYAGDHIGRSDVSGYAHAKTNPDDSFYFANVFDILYAKGKVKDKEIDRPLNTDPLEERRSILEEVRFGSCEPHMSIIPIRIARNDKDLEEAIDFFRKVKGSEGAMIKSLKSTYPLTGQTSLWIKFKNEADLDVEVITVFGIKDSPDTFNYLTIIRDQNGTPIPSGMTYNTKIIAKVGDIIRVAFVNLNRYVDKKTGRVWYNMWSPRAIELREDKKYPDNTITANRIVKDTHGETGFKPFPKRYEERLKKFSMFQDIFLTYPERKKMRFVLQAHIRGRTVHLDNRRQIDNDFAVGMTHFLPIGLSRQPESFEDAKDLYYKEIHPTVMKMILDNKERFLSGRKALVPIEWLDIQGRIEKQEPGATTNLPGFLLIIDKGYYEAGALQPDFHEYFYHGKILEGKYVDRLIENRKEWKKIGEDLLSWMFFRAETDPYVLSRRAVDISWVPPPFQSALPSEIEKKIPERLRFWTEKEKPERIRIRNELVETIKKKEISFVSDVRFTLSEMRIERERIVIRKGPKEILYHLSFDFPSEKGLRHFRLEESPIENDMIEGYFQYLDDKTAMTLSGPVKPQTALNPFRTLAVIEPIDEEQIAEIMEWNPDFIKVKFKGEHLTGIWIIVRESKDSNLWRMERSEIPIAIDVTPSESKIKREQITTQPDNLHHEFSSVHSFSFSERKMSSETNVPFIEMTGILFHRGLHKGIYYADEELKKARLIPREGERLCYVNWQHVKNEEHRVGILTDLWWDDNVEWYCPNNKERGNGALIYRSIITDPVAIEQILKNEIKNVSAELRFKSHKEEIDGEMFEVATEIEVNGKAITNNPAIKAADIEQVCSVTRNDKRICKNLS